MSSYGATYHRQAAPESWRTTSYTIRRPGNTAWADGIGTLPEARAECQRANQVCPGHRVYAEQTYIGDSVGSLIAGETTRTIEPLARCP